MEDVKNFIKIPESNSAATGKDGLSLAETADAKVEAQPKPVIGTEPKRNPTGTSSKRSFLSVFENKLSLKDKIIFTEQMEIMIRSGLSIIDALKSLRDETENKHFAKLLDQVIDDVSGGTPLSTALAKNPQDFNEIYVNMIRSGEKSGNVDMVLRRMTQQLQKDYELNRKVRSAMAYPILVTIALIAVTVLVLVIIIPQLQAIFEETGVPLPLSTRIVLFISSVIKDFGVFVAFGAAIASVLILRWKKTALGRRFFDRLILKIPIIGLLMKKTYMARFTRTFSSLTASGLPLLEVFRTSSNVVGNVLYQEEIVAMSAKVKNGALVSATLKESKLFPKVIGQLASVGEKSGSLDTVFENMADFFDRDVDTITSNLSTLLEPFLMIMMGIGIGGIIISVLQPIYGLVNAL
ncbi:MAG: type II secretion system F family protein [Patescibacteria group bacterium]